MILNYGSEFTMDLTVEEFVELVKRTTLFKEVKIKPEVEEPITFAVPDPNRIVNAIAKLKDKGEEYLKEDNLVGTIELADYLGVGHSTMANFRAYGMPYITTDKTVAGMQQYKYDKESCKKWYDEDYKGKLRKGRYVDVTNTDKELLNTNEMAAVLNVSLSTMHTLRKHGMPYIKSKNPINGRLSYRHKKDECISWFENYTKEKELRHASKPQSKNETVEEKINYIDFKYQLNEICKAKHKDIGKMLSATYKYMTKKYGIVWDQLAKDYYKAEGHKALNTLRLAYWYEQNNPACKNLTSACLETVVNGES